MTDIYAELFELNPRPMWVFDRETLQFVLVNQAASRLYGWTRDEFLAMTLRDIRDPSDLPRFERVQAEVRDVQTSFRRTGFHRTKDGREMEVEVEVTRVDYRGRPASLTVITDVTGVREAERRNRLILEHSADGISVVDLDGTVRYMSPGGERLLGLRPGEHVGKHATLRVHPDDRPTMTMAQPGETRRFVNRARHGDGSWRWLASTTTNLTHDPEVRGHVASFRDVTAQVEAERALQEAHRRLEFLMTAASGVIYSARTSGHVGATFISANVCDMLGWPAEKFVGSTFWLDSIHVDDRPAIERGMAQLLETGSHDFEYRLRHRDGQFRWIHEIARVVRDERARPDEPSEVVGYLIDITERKRIEESMRNSEGNFRMLIERAPTAILVHRDGKLLYANPAAVALLDYDSADQLIGRALLEFIHPDDRDLIRTRIEHTSREGFTRRAEARMRRRDGSYVMVDGEGVRLDFDGEPANVVLGRDVTERNQMFARMAIADRMLTVGTLAAGVAHEINNPLSYVMSSLAVLAAELPVLVGDDARRRSRLDQRAVEQLLADAREGTSRVSAIVRDLRALSRSDDATPTAVDVASVLASSIRMASNEIRHRARVVEHYGAAPQVRASASRLGQVFLNLLVNAAQAIPEGHAEANEIRVRLASAGAASQAAIEIEDTGVGIPASVIGRIFDPFFTTKPVGLGVGLGLAISHQIVTALGGTITVTSTPGTGTTFRIVLPAAQVPPPEPRLAAGAAPPVGSRVLMIDDEVQVGRSTRMLLSPDYDIMPVTRAREGLELLASGERFDAILCDLMMPEMSGVEFYQVLSRTAPHHARRIVFLTGGAFTQQTRDFLATITQPRLEKPFREDDLRAAIEAVRAATSSEDPA
ncbi:MAG TPA: PAS domain S-box protein [Kofleriaceae bacterium]|nr:PAS domain S-box protein [Kofleriaceae bacterium]